MYFEYYIMGIILLPGLLFAIYAQSKVNSTFREYRRVMAHSNITASELIKRLLNSSELGHINVRQINGTLTDYYDPQKEEICLSSDVYNSSSIASLGVACHELGHALQKKDGYLPYKIRTILVPITNIISTLLWPLIIIGLIFNIGVGAGGTVGNIFLWSGIIFFGIAVIFDLATLPVEYNASNRALKILETTGTLNEEELEGTKKVLNSAALTYVAQLLVSILNLVRFLLVALRHRSRD